MLPLPGIASVTEKSPSVPAPTHRLCSLRGARQRRPARANPRPGQRIIMKGNRQRTYVRLQFDLPAAAADEAAALLVANRALGCEGSKLRPARPAPARAPRRRAPGGPLAALG